MAKKTVEIITCDRCSKEVKLFELKFLDYFFNLSVVESFYIYGSKVSNIRKTKLNKEREDLCESCYKSFKMWWNDKR